TASINTNWVELRCGLSSDSNDAVRIILIRPASTSSSSRCASWVKPLVRLTIKLSVSRASHIQSLSSSKLTQHNQWLNKSAFEAKVMDELSGASVWRIRLEHPNTTRLPLRAYNVKPLLSRFNWSASCCTLLFCVTFSLPKNKVVCLPSNTVAASGCMYNA